MYFQNKLAPRCSTLPFPAVKLDSSDVTKWDECVRLPVRAIIEDLSTQNQIFQMGENSTEPFPKLQLSSSVREMCRVHRVEILEVTLSLKWGMGGRGVDGGEWRD